MPEFIVTESVFVFWDFHLQLVKSWGQRKEKQQHTRNEQLWLCNGKVKRTCLVYISKANCYGKWYSLLYSKQVLYSPLPLKEVNSTRLKIHDQKITLAKIISFWKGFWFLSVRKKKKSLRKYFPEHLFFHEFVFSLELKSILITFKVRNILF